MSEPIIKMSGGVIRQQKNTILKNVNIEIQSGEFVYLIGKVGSGKSSFLKTLYAELPLEYGNAEVAGFQLKKIKKSHVPLLRRKCGIVFQDFKLLIDRSVYSNLEFVLRATGWKSKKEILERIETVLEKVGMTDKKHKMPHQLSGGEQQRIVLARALLNAPPLILADEPTGNIDPETSYKLVELLKEICETGKTIIIATHQYDLIEKYPGRILCCDDGSLFEKSSLTADELEEEANTPEDQEQTAESSPDSNPITPAEFPVSETGASSMVPTEIQLPETASLASEQPLQTKPENEAGENILQESVSEECISNKKASGENTPKENIPEENTAEKNIGQEIQIKEKITESEQTVQPEQQTEEQTEDLSTLIGELSFPEITAFDYEIAESPVYEPYSIEKALQEEDLTPTTNQATKSNESKTEKTNEPILVDDISQTEVKETENSTETAKPKETEESKQKPAPPVFDLELSDL